MEDNRVMPQTVIGGKWVEYHGLGTLAIDCRQFMFVPQIADLIEVLMNGFGLTAHTNKFIFYNRERARNKTVYWGSGCWECLGE